QAGSGVCPFVALSGGLAGQRARAEPLQALRRAAFERFTAIGFPTTKNEDWHYTSVAPIVENEYTALLDRTGDVQRADLVPFEIGGRGWHTMVCVNGRYASEL